MFSISLRNHQTLGIDLSDEMVRSVLVSNKGGEASSLRWSEVAIAPSPEGLSPETWSAALQKLLKKYSLSRVDVAVSLPPSSYFIARYQLPNVPSKKVGDLILSRLEEEQLPFPLEECTITYSEQPNAPKGTWMVVCTEKSRTAPLFSTLHSAGVTRFFLLPSEVTLFNCLKSKIEENETKTVATLRLGRKQTLLTFFDKAGFQLRRIFPFGRDEVFSRILAADLVADKTAATKKELAEILSLCALDQEDSNGGGEDYAASPQDGIFDAIRPVLMHLTSSVLKTFHFYRNRIGKSGVSALYLIDDFTGFNGICPFLEERLQVKVEFLSSLAETPLSPKTRKRVPLDDKGSCFTGAVGSALETSRDLSLIPREEMFLPKLRVFRTVTRLTAVIVCLGMVIFSFFNSYGFKNLAETSISSRAIAQELEGILAKENQVSILKQENERWASVTGELVPAGGTIKRVMKEMSRLTSPFVTLDELDIKARAKGSSLEMKGIFAVKEQEQCNSIRADFVNSLEASPLLENVSMLTLQTWQPKGKYLASRFRLTADLTHPVEGQRPSGGGE